MVKSIIKTVLSILWLVLAVYLMISILFDRFGAADSFSEKIDLKTTSYFSGGKPVIKLDNNNYITNIHEPVYQGFPFRKKHGYMHIEWIWDETEPNIVGGSYDLDSDGEVDINISYNLEKDKLTWESKNEEVLGPMVTNSILTYMRVGREDDLNVYMLENSRAVKIMIKRGFADIYYKD